MIASPSVLATYAKEAGMKVPGDPERFANEEKEAFPHFFVFCAMQLGAPMPSPTAGWDNAKVIADVPEEDIKTITPEQLRERGFVEGYAVP